MLSLRGEAQVERAEALGVYAAAAAYFYFYSRHHLVSSAPEEEFAAITSAESELKG